MKKKARVEEENGKEKNRTGQRREIDRELGKAREKANLWD